MLCNYSRTRMTEYWKAAGSSCCVWRIALQSYVGMCCYTYLQQRRLIWLCSEVLHAGKIPNRVIK